MLPHLALLLAVHVATQPRPKPPPPKDQPVPRYAIPLVVPSGKSKLVLRGAKLDTASEVKADGGAVKLLAKRKAAVPNNYPAEKVGDTEVEVELELPADFKGESVAFTVVTPGGTSDPLAVPLAGKNAVAEKEPNDGFDKAQDLTLPATVDATIGREKDTDVFKFTGKKGQKVTAEVLAAVYGSPADLLLTVYDANRQIILTVDDVGGKLDPKAVLTLPADGVYYISVLEAHDLGGTGFGYRLTIK